MSDGQPKMNKTRRGFLRKALAAIGGGLMLAASGKLSAQDPPAAEKKDPDAESAGYRETDHIRAYYDSARF
ncbi:MAG: twin-arginine translocation signal domain-containing protein [Pseudomonadota bacterium]